MRQLAFLRRRQYAFSKADYIAVLIIFVISLVTLLWFKGDYVLNGVDSDYPITPVADFVRSTFAWWDRGLGASNVRGLALAPVFTFPQSVLSSIGMSVSAIQQVIFYLLVAASGVSMYVLMRKLVISKRRFSFAASLVSANLYMFNMFALLFLYQPLLVNALYMYALLPAIFLFFVKSFESKKYLAVLGVLFFLATPSANNPSFYVTLVILIALYSFYVVFAKRTKQNLVNVLLTNSFVFVVFILVNSFWILPVLTSVGQQYSVWLSGNQGAAINSFSNFSEMFRFLGWWAFSADYKGSPYFPYHSVYYTPTFVLLGFVIPLVAFLSLFFAKRFGKFVLFFGLVSIVGLLLQKGEIDPFAFLNTWFYTLPGSLAFDGPKFGALYAFAVAALLGISVQYFVERVSFSRSINFTNVKVGAVAALFLIVVNLYAWPFWTGDLHSLGDDFPPRQITVPPYYTELADYLNGQPGSFRVLGLPNYEGVPSLWVPYTWGYLGVDPLWHYLSVPYVLPNGYQGGPGSVLYQLAAQEDFSGLVKLASVLNVQYIVVRGDVDCEFYDGCVSPNVINGLLRDQPEVVYVGQFGELVLYKIDSRASSWIYTSSSAILAKSSQLFPLVATDAIGPNSSIMLDSNSAGALADTDLNVIEYDTVNVSLSVSNGRRNSVDWSSVSADNFEARSYTGWKGIISVTGTGDSDMLIFDSPEACPYVFPEIEDKNWWSGYRSTLIYLQTGYSPLILNGVSVSGESMPVVGVWWDNGWMGMGTRSVVYPIILPPNQRVIIQVGQLVTGDITLNYSPAIDSPPDISADILPEVEFQRISPVEYVANLQNVVEPFFLVLSESYDTLWSAIIAGQAIDGKYHFMANGYSNVWYIDPAQLPQTDDGSFTVTLYYAPQNLFYVGLTISLVSVLTCCISYVVFSSKRFRRT